MLLEIQTRTVQPDITVLKFAGKITLGRESQRIETLVKDLLQQDQKKIVFDLADVSYIDSAGLGIITFCSASVREAGGRMGLTGASGIAQRLFQITKLNEILAFYDNLEAACQGIGGDSATPTG